jgi:hypothetical protein
MTAADIRSPSHPHSQPVVRCAGPVTLWQLSTGSAAVLGCTARWLPRNISATRAVRLARPTVKDESPRGGSVGFTVGEPSFSRFVAFLSSLMIGW